MTASRLRLLSLLKVLMAADSDSGKQSEYGVSSSAMAALHDLEAVAAELAHSQFEPQDIAATVRDVQCRLEWRIGSECSVYSRSSQKWVSGQIVSVRVDTATAAEWMRIRYGANKKKEIQRFSIAVRPKEVGNEYILNPELYRLITERLRERRTMKQEEGLHSLTTHKMDALIATTAVIPQNIISGTKCGPRGHDEVY